MKLQNGVVYELPLHKWGKGTSVGSGFGLGCRLRGCREGWVEAQVSMFWVRAFGLWLCQHTQATVQSIGNERQDQILQRLADLWGSCNLNLV